MRLLFVHEVNYLRKVVYETQEYPERLAARGHEVTYLDFPEGEPRRGLRRFVDLTSERRLGVLRAAEGPGIELVTPGRVFAPPLDRLCASLSHVPTIRSLLRRRRFDAIVLYAIPTNGWQTVLLAKRFGVPVLFRAIDVPTEMRRTVFRGLVERAARFVYRRANAVSTHTGPLRDYCVRMGAAPDRVSIEYPGFDLARFSPGPRDERLSREYGIAPGDRVVAFMGEFHYFSAVTWLVEAFAPHLRANPGTHLLLIGDKPAVGGTSVQEVRELAQRLGVERAVKAVGRIEFEGLPPHLRLADVGVVPLRPMVQSSTALPSKALQYLACGLPVVSTPLPGLQSVVPNEETGILYRELGPSFTDAVVDLLTHDGMRTNLAREARASMESLFDWDRCLTAFEERIRRTIERQARETGRGSG